MAYGVEADYGSIIASVFVGYVKQPYIQYTIVYKVGLHSLQNVSYLTDNLPAFFCPLMP